MTQKRTLVKFAVLMAISIVAAYYTLFDYMGLTTMLGRDRYQVTVELPVAAGLYPNANVTYHGIEVGQVKDVRLTQSGVEAILSLNSAMPVPSDLEAQVHSVSAIGEQYVALQPRKADSPPLRNGDVIDAARTTVPPDISSLLDATNSGLQAIPRDNLKTVIDESQAAVGGLGWELSRMVKGSTTLAIGARDNLDSLTTLIDKSGPVLDSQASSADSIQAWAKNLAAITSQLKDQDAAVGRVIDHGGKAADQGRQLFERLKPTLPLILANLVSVGQVAVTYHANLEQLLVLVPQSVAVLQSTFVPDLHTKHPGVFLDFLLNLNLPPPCTTGFLPAQQRRSPSDTDAPERPSGSLYCRLPQDSPYNVRGARNMPCETVPGKRAPTVKMCESNEDYVPLNNGENWKGDPNATLSGQAVPQPPPDSAPGTVLPPAATAPAGTASPPPLAVTSYDPATGKYVGSDGQTYAQQDLSSDGQPRSWQQLVSPRG
jgi:phospholipid/cholesterol/gamma-HCH transport system substrate-binding protein